MNILVIGCGKTGTQLCNELSQRGHDVSVIDSSINSFQNLSDSFNGYTITGVPIDQDVLRQAGAESCDAIAAVSEDDNMNLMVCQLAREVFHVPRMLARIYDPQRGEVFRHFGLQTICPTNLSVDAICSILLENDRLKTIQLDCASVAFDAVETTELHWGKTLGDLSAKDNEKSGLFGMLKPDGNLVLACASSTRAVKPGDRLLYAKVVD